MERKPVIAVVDDEKSMRRALERLLRSAAMDVFTFSSGAPFLDSIRSQHFDCIVLDLHMSGINGFEVLAHLKQSVDGPPVILMTGHDSPDTRARVISAGANAYLLKPIDERELLDAIANSMTRHSRA